LIKKSLKSTLVSTATYMRNSPIQFSHHVIILLMSCVGCRFSFHVSRFML
jgi:hypothetical protein